MYLGLSGTFYLVLETTPVYIWPCVLGYCPAEKSINLTVSGGKQTEPGFPVRFLLCLASFSFFFILKNSPVLNRYKHTHNMMQPPLCLKIWRVVLRNVLYWFSPKHKTFRIQDKKLLCHIFCIITLVPCWKPDACFGIFLFCVGFFLFTLSIRLVLWHNYNVVDPSSIFLYHSH